MRPFVLRSVVATLAQSLIGGATIVSARRRVSLPPTLDQAGLEIPAVEAEKGFS
jgi:hypothetical protein